MSAAVSQGLPSGSVRRSGTRYIWDPTTTPLDTGVQALKLSQFELRTGIKEERVKEEIAGLRSDRYLRIFLGIVVIALFVALNGVVVWLIYEAVGVDNDFIEAGTLRPADRLITEKVYMSLVGATVVQVSSILFAIARYLFPSSKDSSDDD